MRLSNRDKIRRAIARAKLAERTRLQKTNSVPQWKFFVLDEDLEPGDSADAKPAKRNSDGSFHAIGDKTYKVHDFGLFGGVSEDVVDPVIESGSAILCFFESGSWLGIVVETCPGVEGA